LHRTTKQISEFQSIINIYILFQVSIQGIEEKTNYTNYILNSTLKMNNGYYLKLLKMQLYFNHKI